MSLLDLVRDPAVRGRKFTATDVRRMLETGLLEDGDRSELLDGELIERPLQGDEHLNLSTGLVDWMARRLPESFKLAANGPLRLSEQHEPEPDFYVFPRAMNVNAVRGPDTALVAEVAMTSLRLDRLVKAPVYAAHGVRLYWVIDIKGRVTWVHRLRGDGYDGPEAVPFDRPLVTLMIAEPLIVAQLLE